MYWHPLTGSFQSSQCHTLSKDYTHLEDDLVYGESPSGSPACFDDVECFCQGPPDHWPTGVSGWLEHGRHLGRR